MTASTLQPNGRPHGAAVRLVAALVLLLMARGLGAATQAQEQEPPRPGLTVRLVDPPVLEGDSRGIDYVIGHHQPGDVVERVVEVANGDDEPMAIEMGIANARAEDGWVVEAGFGGEVADWSTISPGAFVLEPGERREVGVRIAIPSDAFGGERYGAIMASPEPVDTGAALVVGRVGIRVYLSVGGPEAPVSDFEIDTLQALRLPDGAPAVRIGVTNVGERILDVSGTLRLDDGPGGLAAGPFPVSFAKTLGPGSAGELIVPLDPELPVGPWRAIAALTGGPVQRSAEAEITFPNEGTGTVDPSTGIISSSPVPAIPLDRGTLLPLNLVLFLLALIVLGVVWGQDRLRAGRAAVEGSDPEPSSRSG